MVSVAQAEISFYQRTTGHLILRSAFERYIRELIQDEGKSDYRVQREAFNLLQTETEAFMVNWFNKTGFLSHHRGGITVTPKDFDALMAQNYMSGGYMVMPEEKDTHAHKRRYNNRKDKKGNYVNMPLPGA